MSVHPLRAPRGVRPVGDVSGGASPAGHTDDPDRFGDIDRERASLVEPCPHYYRTDWIDEDTCGCGERVF